MADEGEDYYSNSHGTDSDDVSEEFREEDFVLNLRKRIVKLSFPGGSLRACKGL